MADDLSVIKLGPVGNSNGGTAWDHKGCNKIVQIIISHGDRINWIQFLYNENGTLLPSERIGADTDGNNSSAVVQSSLIQVFEKVKLNYQVEYLTSISGHKNNGNGDICSIKFTTNCGEYGPFGRSTKYDGEFIIRFNGDRLFSGFFGTADTSGLKSIGVYLKLIETIDGKSAVVKKLGKSGHNS